MPRSSKAIIPRFLAPPGGSSQRTTSPGSASAAAPAWLRRVLAVPAALAMLTFALVMVTPQLSSPVSAQTPSCSAKVTAAPTGPATVSAASNAYGRVLVIGSGEYSGCSLYVLTTDEMHTLTSGKAPFACTDSTANAFKASCDTVLWPALLTDGAPIAGRGVNPTLLGTVARTDVLPGTSVQQVTYGGLPLYRMIFDDAPGQTTGATMLDPVTVPQGMWYLVDPIQGRPAPGQALIGQETAPVYQNGKSTGISATVLAVSESTGLSGEVNAGGIADGPVSVPVYTFSLDKGHQSACQGMCAMYWSPVLTSMSPEAGAGVDRDQLGIIVRPNGTHQVTFDGHPLYMFHADASLPLVTPAYPPNINGAGVQAFGGAWQAVQPS
jgi:predicted lipoprotein with Yx(FWY)xxD motif